VGGYPPRKASGKRKMLVPVLEEVAVIFSRFERVSSRVPEVAYWTTVNLREALRVVSEFHEV